MRSVLTILAVFLVARGAFCGDAFENAGGNAFDGGCNVFEGCARQGSDEGGAWTPASLSGLKCWLEFDADLSDSSGNGNNGTKAGAGTLTYSGGSAVFTNAYVVLGNAIVTPTAWTAFVRGYEPGAYDIYAAWWYMGHTANGRGAYEGPYTPGPEYMRSKGVDESNVEQWAKSRSTYAHGQWHSVCTSYTNNLCRVFASNNDAAPIGILVDTACNVDGWTIGYHYLGYYNGILNQTGTRNSAFLLYDRALTSNECVQVMNYMIANP